MNNISKYHSSQSTHGQYDRVGGHSLMRFTFVFFVVMLLAGCMGPTPLHLQNHFPMKDKHFEIPQANSSPASAEKDSIGMVIALLPESYQLPKVDEGNWAYFAARVKNEVEGTTSRLMEKFILVSNLGTPESVLSIQKFGKDNQIDIVLVVLPSGVEVSGPAKFDLLPEVSLLNGRQIDHHATVELGLVDAKSGSLLLQVQGNSYATLEELDIPIDSNRYPRVRGSAMSSYIYPENDKALDVLRAVALKEALEQATMKLQMMWQNT